VALLVSGTVPAIKELELLGFSLEFDFNFYHLSFEIDLQRINGLILCGRKPQLIVGDSHLALQPRKCIVPSSIFSPDHTPV
jgi:hypothetical protein